MKRRNSRRPATARTSMGSLMRPAMVNDEVSFHGAFVRMDRAAVLRLPRRRVVVAAAERRTASGADRRVAAGGRGRVDDRARGAAGDSRVGAACLPPRRLLPQRIALRRTVHRGRSMAAWMGP